MANYLTRQDLTNVIGTWHKEGFHGHNRAKSRIEFSNLYRQYAKPLPPEKFKTRVREDVMKHTFSKHDNKQVFLNDPNLFGNGIGKRKIDSLNKSKWDPEFMSWSEDAGRDRFRKTIYQNDYCVLPNNTKLLTGRKNLENRPVSIYALNFSHGEPTADTSKEARLDTYTRFISRNRAKSCVGSERTSVANCLVWQAPAINQSKFQVSKSISDLSNNVNNNSNTTTNTNTNTTNNNNNINNSVSNLADGTVQ